MKVKKTQTIELDSNDLAKAVAEYARAQAGGIRTAIDPIVRLEASKGSPGSRGRDSELTATVTFELPN